jgi:hypothetical protein
VGQLIATLADLALRGKRRYMVRSEARYVPSSSSVA